MTDIFILQGIISGEDAGCSPIYVRPQAGPWSPKES